MSQQTLTHPTPKVIAMEACASAHYWARCWLAAGREVRLINPRFVKPFVMGSKNDALRAGKVDRPAGPAVAPSCPRPADLQRTALINHTRGLLAEYGIVLPQGPWRFTAQAPALSLVPICLDLARAIFSELLDQLDDLDRRIKKFDATMVNLCRTNEMCRRLAKLPGVGPVVATAIVVAINEGRQFRSGREMAAWIGLVPRQYTTGGKPRLGGIGRRANHFLRRQLIHGARAVVGRLPKRDDQRANWLKALVGAEGAIMPKCTVAYFPQCHGPV